MSEPGQQIADALVIANTHLEAMANALGALASAEFEFDSLADGTDLADFSNGASATPGWDVQETGFLRWNNHTSHTAVMAKTALLPSNFDGSRDATLKVVAAKTGATDADDTTFDVTLYVVSVGDAYDADTNFGATTPAFTGTATAKTLQQVALTLLASNLPDSGPAFLALTIKPTDLTLQTDDLILVSVFLEYHTKAPA